MRRTTVERPWGAMRVWEGGLAEGPALLALHGLGGSGRYWQGLEPLVGDRFRLVAPDLAGFGGSDKPKDAPYDRGFHLADLDALAARERGPLVVIGHSLGGVLGVLWAGRHPARVGGLALGASPFPEARPQWDPARWQGARRAVPAAVTTAVRVTWPVLSLPAQAFTKYPPGVVRDFGRQTLESRSWTLWSLWSDPSLQGDVDAAAAAIAPDTPVLILHADDDRSVPPSDAERWAGAIPGATSRGVPTGGHQFFVRGEGFAVLATWLRGLGGHGASPGPGSMAR